MDEATNIYPNLNDQKNLRLSKINEVKDHFIAKIRERELISKNIVQILLLLTILISL